MVRVETVGLLPGEAVGVGLAGDASVGVGLGIALVDVAAAVGLAVVVGPRSAVVGIVGVVVGAVLRTTAVGEAARTVDVGLAVTVASGECTGAVTRALGPENDELMPGVGLGAAETTVAVSRQTDTTSSSVKQMIAK